MTADTLWEHYEKVPRAGASVTILGKGDHEETRSLERILEDAERAAAGLHARGVGPGDAVAMVAATSFDFLTGCLSAWRLGAAFASLPPAPRLASREAFLAGTRLRMEKTRAKFLMTGPDQPRVEIDVPTFDVSADDGSAPIGPQLAEPSHAAVIQFTSGSTSDPKAVVLSHERFVNHLRSFTSALDRDPMSGVMSWLPMYHDLGFVDFGLCPLFNGWPLTLLPTELFLADPSRWMREISRTKASHTAAPNFAYGLAARFMAKDQAEGLDLSNLQFAGCGGEAVDHKTVKAFLTATEPLGLKPRAFVVGYGMAECVCAAVLEMDDGLTVDHVDRDEAAVGRATPAASDSRRVAAFASVGTPMDTVKVRIDGADGSDRMIGEILLDCPFLMDCYLDDEEATAATFTQDGWLRTGDLGYVVDGRLYVTGRAKDVIIVRGHNYYAEDIERLVQEAPGVRRGNTVAFAMREGDTEQVVVIAESRAADPDEAEQVRSAIGRIVSQQTGLTPHTIEIVPPGTIPKTSSGKLQRGVVRKVFAERAAEAAMSGTE